MRVVPFCLRCRTPWRTGLLETAEGDAVTCRTCLPRSVCKFRHAAVVPVAEPHLLSLVVHVFLIEDTRMCDEAIEQILMHAREIIN